MFSEIHPKLPMRSKSLTRDFYINKLGFQQSGSDFEGYLMVYKDNIQIHFFEFKDLNPLENYGQVYIRANDIEAIHTFMKEKNITFSSGGRLELKPWGMKEFSVLDPDHNLLTFGENI